MAVDLGRVSIVGKGEYSPTVQYERLDVVRYNGAAYLVLKDVKGVTPAAGANYMLLVEDGTDGAPGAQGPAGTNGTNGTNGAQGPAGPGVASGGSTGQALVKNSSTNYDTTWKTLTASDVGALPISGGTLTGNLTIKGSGNYGTKINLGDDDYVHISEPSDDQMEIKASTVNFVTSQTPGLQLNGGALISCGTTDLTAGSSALKAGTLYGVYEA